MKKQENTFVALLDLLKINYTKDFSNQYFNEHPHKYNLFGLSKMLLEYGIENAAIRIGDKEKDIFEIEAPFIAHFGGDFAVVQKIEPDKVSFLWRANKHVLPVSEFVKAWTGIVLLAEPSEKSIEPDYREHKKNERLNFLKKAALITACSLILFLAYINRSLYTNPGISLLLLLNFSGIFISWLLLLKQMRIQNQYADKICSLFKQSDCNNVLETKEAKLLGIFSWSEIGLTYFASNVVLILFLPYTVSLLALLNLFTLPYSFWSVWHQKVKAKQWCVLCLIVQVLLWAIFAVNCLFGYVRLPDVSYQELFNLLIIGSCYLAALSGINLFDPKLNAGKMLPSLRHAINSMKADENIFSALLKQQPYYKTHSSESIIRFGNPDSPFRITVLTNPYCNPCSLMHKRIERLLEKTNNHISIQYILASFSENLNSTNKYLIAACLASLDPIQVFTDWFEKGKALKDDFFKDMHLEMDNPEIEIEFQRHEN